MGLLEEANKRTQWLDRPKYPGFVGRVQHVKYIYTNPCDVPFIYYVETALPALGIALFEYFDFGVMDIVRGFTKPRALARGFHGCRRRRARKGRVQLPDFGDEIGKKLRPDAMYNRPITNGQLHLWMVYGRLERLMWWWMVADISANFLYNWGSALYNNEYCSKKTDRRAAWLHPSMTHIPLVPKAGISGGQRLYANPTGPWAGSWGFSIPAGWRGHAVLGGSVVPNNPSNPPLNPRLGWETNAPGNAGGKLSGPAHDHGDRKDLIVTTELLPGVSYAPYAQIDGGGACRFQNVQQVYWASPR